MDMTIFQLPDPQLNEIWLQLMGLFLEGILWWVCLQIGTKVYEAVMTKKKGGEKRWKV